MKKLLLILSLFVLVGCSKQENTTDTFCHELENNGVEDYILTLKIKQSTFTIDPGEHIKNNANAVEMSIPVSESFYNSVQVNQELNNEFKTGSLIFNGDASWLKITVVDKKIL